MTRPYREKRRVTAVVSSQDPKPQIRIPVRQNPDRPSLEAFRQLEAVTMSAEEGASDAKPTENGPLDRASFPELTHNRLVQLVVELKLQNEVLKSQFKDSKDFEQRIREEEQAASDATVAPSDVEQELRGRIESLSRELQEQTQTRGAAEQALQHLGEVHAEADARAQELSLKLSEAQQKLDKEIKDREEKYSELDSKFQRLHKRAKQRIQEVQKEKDDLEVKFRDVNDSAERASSQLSALQQELDRTRQQANEALKAMDAERQQLRSANNKLRDNIEELRRSFEPKENALDTLQQTLLEKDQMLEDMRGLLNSAEEKRQASLAEVSVKHQKNIENLEVQLSDALMDRSKATETISSLQTLIAEKDSRIAELDAASTGKAARLSAALESLKGELAHQKDEHEKEKERWESAFQGLKMKLEVAESNCIRAEIEAAKMKSQLEMEVSSRSQMFNKKEAELLSAKEEISRLESEFSSYKFRAHSLLQKKDAEIAASKDLEQVKALEEALKEVENELAVASTERDKTLQDLQYRKVNYEKQLADRDEALNMAKQQLRNMEMKLDSTITAHLSEKSLWDINLQNLEESWHLRFEALKAETKASSGQDIQREYDDLKLKHKKLTEESDSLRVLADKMVEEKDKEISRLLDDNKKLSHTLELRQQAYQNDKVSTTFQNRDAHSSSSIAEQQILILARQQAQREEQLAQSQRHILALQEEIAELERENRLHSQQEAMLKTELRDMERKQKREGVDMTYLKNVILKLLETGEVEALLPVVATLLQFSPQEVVKCQQAYRANNEVQTTPGSESSASSPLSLFSRFSFS